MIKKAFHIILALLLLLSSTGLVMSQHFCKGVLKSTALFVKAAPCHYEKQMPHCPMHSSSDSEDQKNCCDTETDLIQADNDLIPGGTELKPADVPVLVAVLSVVLRLDVPLLDKRPPPFIHYRPPLLVYDLPLRLQTFLC